MIKFRRSAKNNLPKKRRLPGQLSKREAWLIKRQELEDNNKKKKTDEEDTVQVKHHPSDYPFIQLLDSFKGNPDLSSSSGDDDDDDDDKGMETTATTLKDVQEEEPEEHEQDSDPEEDSQENLQNDTYFSHFESNHGEDFLKIDESCYKKSEIFLSSLESSGKVSKRHPSLKELKVPENASLKKLNIKESLIKTCSQNLSQLSKESKILRLQLLSTLTQYPDICLPHKKPCQANDIRWSYCLHVVNHLLKVRQTVLKNKAKIEEMGQNQIEDEFRDQGFTRSRVLILVPFRESAKEIVLTLSKILFGSSEDKGLTIGMARFLSEFGSEQEKDEDKTNMSKPLDFVETFKGNTDDSFRIGMKVTKKSLKLYTDFYESDIILCSPLTLRMKIKDPEAADYDFLSSIEILIMDQMEVFLMQNWEHVIEIMKHVNQTPVDSRRGIDFSRVKMYLLDGKASSYRQNIFISSNPFMELTSLFFKYSNNFEGRILLDKIISPEDSSISRVFVKALTHSFLGYSCSSSSLVSCPDSRFEFFVKKILPGIQEEKHVLVYFSSYFDFVRVRNYLKKETDTNFVSLCEYTSDGKIAQGRSQLFHENKNILLFTERLHFYRRLEIKGVRKVIFYQLPNIPLFYSQVCNFMMIQGKKFTSSSNLKSTAVFCRTHDSIRLEGVLGSSKTKQIMKKKTLYNFVSQ